MKHQLIIWLRDDQGRWACECRRVGRAWTTKTRARVNGRRHVNRYPIGTPRVTDALRNR